MTFDEILLRTKDLGLYERRSMSPEYCELVFFSRDIEAWYETLSSILGEARKKPGTEPTDSDLDITRKTGGIRANQTLFEKEFDGKTVIAKIWPWDDGEHMTLKMAVLFE
jgi:hypothetical protein